MARRTPPRPFTTMSYTYPTSARSTSARCSSPVDRAASPWCGSSWAAPAAVRSLPRKARRTPAPGRPVKSMRLLTAAIVLLCGCGVRPAERLDVLFDSASDELHAGELAQALLAADRGIAVSTRRHDLAYEWKFRLLRCDLLLNNGRAEEVVNQLRGDMPSTP